MSASKGFDWFCSHHTTAEAAVGTRQNSSMSSSEGEVQTFPAEATAIESRCFTMICTGYLRVKSCRASTRCIRPILDVIAVVAWVLLKIFCSCAMLSTKQTFVRDNTALGDDVK